MNKITINNQIEKYIYTGAFDLNNENKIVKINVGEEIYIDINIAVNSTRETLNKLSIEEVKQICNSNNIKATIYPSGNASFSKLDSNDDELKNCYISIVQNTINKYLICIAFDETQPAFYKAQLLSVFKIED